MGKEVINLVFVIQENATKNISPALEYGELKILLPPGQVTFSPGPSIARLRRGLKNFSDNDYLLCIGDPIAIGMASIIAAENNAGRVKYLKWDNQEHRYLPITVDVNFARKEIDND
jgi:hypothetical protein